MSTVDPSSSAFTPLEGGCDCRQVRYRLLARPLFTHCCHCRWCQRETGSAFVLNAMIEADNVELLTSTAPDIINTPSESGRGQQIARCPECRLAVWSNYGALGDVARFVRVGTLDNPDAVPPDIHIYTASKQPWITLGDGKPIVEEFYDRNERWPKESLERRRVMVEKWERSESGH